MWLWHLRSPQALTHGKPAGAGPSTCSRGRSTEPCGPSSRTASQPPLVLEDERSSIRSRHELPAGPDPVNASAFREPCSDQGQLRLDPAHGPVTADGLLVGTFATTVATLRDAFDPRRHGCLHRTRRTRCPKGRRAKASRKHGLSLAGVSAWPFWIWRRRGCDSRPNSGERALQSVGNRHLPNAFPRSGRWTRPCSSLPASVSILKRLAVLR